MLKITKRHYLRAKEEKILRVTHSKRRVVGLIGSEHPHLCWITRTGRYWCSCSGFPKTLYMCEHLGVLATLFTDFKVRIVG